ncbi:MAG: thrombospondin type 3 repeat-containing protein [Candidatus Gracilibacteria bacterium]|nr:thrombospondin type 3 repeat-containing protein [Candidatus Gracilibacteria bacterium]
MNIYLKVIKIASIMTMQFYIFSNFNTALASYLDYSCFKESVSFDTNFTEIIKVKIINNDTDILFFQGDELVPYKVLEEEKVDYINYTILGVSSGNNANIKFINDGNEKTAFEFDELNDMNKNIIIDFGSKINGDEIIPHLIFNSAGKTLFYISEDNSNYRLISENSINEFNFRYLKIELKNYENNTEMVKTKIFEINFLKPTFSTYVLRPLNNSTVNVYRKYNCNAEKISKLISEYQRLNNRTSFSIDSNTKELQVNFQKNSKYSNDFDSDGILNDIDNCKFSSNKDQLDSDRDGIGDMCDSLKFSKNPNDIDTDKDSIPDSRDNCKYIFNPNQKDSNADGFGDVCMDDDGDRIMGARDNCPNISNPDQKDINANGVGDACEFDKDKDNIFDGIDNCINTPNPDQLDDDEDGIGNVCDNCNLYNPNQLDKNNNNIGDICEEAEKYAKEHDTDKDGILDFNDNCKNISNPLQEDIDKDSIGDLCDNCLDIQNTDQKDENKNGKGDICEDSDKDGIDGYQDNCPYEANPLQKDSDNNGVGDVCEDSDKDNITNAKDNCPYNYNIDQSDVDKDGKGDVCDTKDDRYIESNKSFFIGLMISIVAIFGVLIYTTVNRLKKI